MVKAIKKKYWEKINVDKINWEKLFDKAANHKQCNILWLLTLIDNDKILIDFVYGLLTGMILIDLRKAIHTIICDIVLKKLSIIDIYILIISLNGFNLLP